MNENKLDSLITLLDDPDDSVFNHVLEEIVKEDISLVDRLEHIWETSFDELVQNRIELIIHQIQLNDTKNRIKTWANQKTLDLFNGIFLISRYQYPELKLKPIEVQLENIRKDIWIEFRNSLTSLEKITILNHLFFDHYRFTVDRETPESPNNCYINRILESRKGNPVSIAILYTLIARSLNLPTHYIDFKNNPLVGYFDKDIANLSQDEPRSSVVFYINPSNKGAIIGPREIEYVLQTTDPVEIEMLAQPCPDKIIIKRLIETLISGYDQLRAKEKVDYLKNIADFL